MIDSDDLLDNEQEKPLALVPVMTGAFFNQLIEPMVIVMGLDKPPVGRVKRAYHEQFSDAERRLIARTTTNKLRPWCLVRGLPRRIVMRPATIQLLQRAAAFFGSY